MSEWGAVSTDVWYPVVLLSDSDFKTGQTTKAVGDLTVEYKKLGGGAGWTAYSPAAGNWQEHGDGEYGLQIGASEFGSVGKYQVHVQCSGALTYRFSVDVTTLKVYNSVKLGSDNLEVDTVQIEGADATDQIRDSVVDDTTRIDASALNTASAAIGSDGSGLTEAGGTGDHLTAIPWNVAWDTEVQSECNDALVALGLDHLISASVTGTDVADNSIIAKMVSKSATADWDSFTNTTDSLEALGDALIATTPALIADAVWDEALSGHTNAGSAGEYLQQIIDDYLNDGTIGLSNLKSLIDTIDTNVDSILLDTAEMNGNGVKLSTQGKADVNAEVVDTLGTDTIPELSSGAPAATPTIKTALMLLYMSLRNKNITDTAENKLHNDAGSVICKASVGEAASVFTKDEYTAP